MTLNVPILLLSKPLNQNKHVFLLSPTRSWGAFAVKKNNSKTANQQGCNATKSPSKETSQPILHVPSRVPKDSNLFPTRSAISLQFTWGAFAVKTNKTAIISKAAMLKPTRLQCYQISFYGNFWKGYGWWLFSLKLGIQTQQTESNNLTSVCVLLFRYPYTQQLWWVGDQEFLYPTHTHTSHKTHYAHTP